MIKRIRTIELPGVLTRLFAIAILSLLLTMGCSKAPPVEIQPCPNPATSLLLIPPLIGNENEPRDQPREPERLTLDEESVSGWFSPPEKMLRFPFELREGTHFTFRLGAVSESPVEKGDLVAVVEYKQYDDETGRRGTTHEIYRSEIGPGSDWLKDWIPVDIDLSEWSTGYGELRLCLEGNRASSTGVKVLWGRPAIYHPDEMIHRNVLLIGVDTLRSDGLNIYGGRSEVSPNLERLSESATVFNRAWSQAPFTVPSFASMLTGRYPADLSPTVTFDQLPENVTTVSEILLNLGYATSTICGNAYLGNDNSGFHQGMETLWYRICATPDDSVDVAVEFMEKNGDRDWFLFLHFMDPHGPYDPPQEFINNLCDTNYTGKYQTAFEDGLDWQLTTSIPPASEIKRVRSLYDAEVADLDSAIGDLFGFMESKGLLDDTLIIFASDHGEEFFEHGQFEHGQSLYEEMVHMPLIVWGSGFPDGERFDTPVANLDIVPTIFEYLDFPLAGHFPGIPMQSVINGDAGEGRVIFGEGNLRRSTHQKFAVDWPYKCIQDYFTGESWLYDLVADPDELVDISDLRPEITRSLSERTKIEMLPTQTTCLLSIVGDPTGGPERFSGTIHLPGGIGFITASSPLEEDEFSVDGNTISFNFSSESDIDIKALIVFPINERDAIEITLLADGEIDPERFYPYASSKPEPSGTATIRVHDLPWPAQIPADAEQRPVACYVLGIPGFPREYSTTEFENIGLDEQTLEQLRSLGYI